MIDGDIFLSPSSSLSSFHGAFYLTESLAREVECLTTLRSAIEQYGLHPGMMAIADKDGLLSSTFHQIPSTESLKGPYAPTTSITQNALTGVSEALSEKLAQWAVSTESFATQLVGRLSWFISKYVLNFRNLGKLVTESKKEDKLPIGQKIKKDKILKQLLIAGALISTLAILAIIWARLPSDAVGFGNWVDRIQRAIKTGTWFNGAPKVAMNGAKATATWTAGVSSSTNGFEAMGISSPSGFARFCYKIADGANALNRKLTQLSPALNARTVADKAKYGVYVAATAFAVRLTYILCKNVIVKGLRSLYSGLKSIASAFGI